MPGYVRRGKGSLSFYEGSGDAHHHGYCSDPFDDWSEDQNKGNVDDGIVVSVRDNTVNKIRKYSY